MESLAQECFLIGVGLSPGIGIGKPYIYEVDEFPNSESILPFFEIEKEVNRFKAVISKVKKEIEDLKDHLEKEKIRDGASILESQLHMLDDPILSERIEIEIKNTCFNAETVFKRTLVEYQNKFQTLENSFFQEKFKDLYDISKRVLNHLQPHKGSSIKNVPEGSIVFGREFTVSDIAEADPKKIKGFVCTLGSLTSHATIIAKAKGIPYVSGIDLNLWKNIKNELTIVDGKEGTIIIYPHDETLAKYSSLSEKMTKQWEKHQITKQLDAETYDGYRVRLSANLEMVNEVPHIHQYGASGVGLFRSEYLFLSNGEFPKEEEQFEIYKQMVYQMQGQPIVIRAFDIGGDKFGSKASLYKEDNPFLGCRAIRFLLKEQEIFKNQLRAVLRASLYGDVSLMFPMISTIGEIIEAKKILQEVKDELIAKGMQFNKPLRVGCMIEVPSAAIISDILAEACDFLSIGTNDLVQYSLAVDRSNLTLSNLYSQTHLSIIRLIKHIVSEANQKGVPVTVCGEIAADPRFTPLLLGLGVQELSVSSRYIPLIKNAIRHTSIVSATKLAEKALTLHSSKEIDELLQEEYDKICREEISYCHSEC
ncbi:Phosphoenolpyruvate-protein phosphotransferase [Candidatus Rubidus massiliensis]|nr:Phosphoenolpyruvate-protein phosphotransferase [Candidatus Rubidus massiliensis]